MGWIHFVFESFVLLNASNLKSLIYKHFFLEKNAKSYDVMQQIVMGQIDLFKFAYYIPCSDKVIFVEGPFQYRTKKAGGKKTPERKKSYISKMGNATKLGRRSWPFLLCLERENNMEHTHTPSYRELRTLSHKKTNKQEPLHTHSWEGWTSN